MRSFTIKMSCMINKKWQRIVLLIILAYESWGGITGGTLLAFAPDGHVMKMPTDIMNGVFPDFLIPGLILMAMGYLTIAAFFFVLLKNKLDWLFASLALGGYIIWFAVEIIILQELHWLHIMWGMPVVMGFLLTLPMIPASSKKRFFPAL